MKKNILFLVPLIGLLFTAQISLAQPGYINTIAGNGTSGYSGDGGPATAAEMGQVLGVFADNLGNVYIADYGNEMLRKVTAGGIISTFAGGGSSTADGIPATNASISIFDGAPMATDTYGNIYFADGNRIRKITVATGIIITLVGSTTAGFSGDGGPATAAELSSPHGLCFDGSGNMYIGDEGNYRVRKVNTAGIISTIAGTSTSGFSGDGGPATAAELKSPDGVCIDVAGNIYVADRYNYRIRKIDASGIITTYAGDGTDGFCGDGGPATAACFFEPSYLCTDPFGNLYIADFHNGRIRIVNSSGIVNTFAGGGSSMSSGVPATSESFTDTWGVSIDQYNNIYVPDRTHYRICRVGIGLPTATSTSDSFYVSTNANCSGLNFEIVTNSYSSGQHVETYFGNGFSLDTAVTAYGTRGISSFSQPYLTGTYTIKHVLYDGTVAVDSITYTQDFSACQNFTVKYYYDANDNCIKDSSEPYFYQNIKTEIDSSGIAIDTIASTSGFNYLAYGSSGSVYSFKVISTPAGVHVSCSSSGITNDTMITGTQPIKYVALVCDTTSNFDLAINPIVVVSGVHDQWGHIYVSNTTCYAPNATVTMHFSPIYAFSNATPVQTSVSGNTVIWNIDTLSAHTAMPVDIIWGLSNPASGLVPVGDSTHTDFRITPYAGDLDTNNNYDIIIDTVKAGCDPNEMLATPAACLSASGVPLQYTIHFENTGNDTAFNIYVLDTLSPFVDVSSMKIIMASAEMYVTKFNDAAGQTILKFDFPNINLLDSSYYGFCDGAIIFTVNSVTGLVDGTNIYNRAGVYFDYNAVVMTNQVDNVIGCSTTSVANVQPAGGIQIFPNPATNELTVILSGAEGQFTITNSIGQQMIQQPLTLAQTNVNVSALPPGLYYITFRGDNGTTVQKFVKM